MDKKMKAIKNLRDIYGYGYTEVFTEVTDSVTALHISRTQMNIIQHIYINGSATPSELAEVLNVQKSAITHTVKKLENKKLVTIKENTLINDKRSKLIYMTEDAKTLLEEFLDNILKRIQSDIGELSKEEADKLYTATLTILKYIPGGSKNETRS
ncbi:MarR family winged helix-turn-helix transcriptional regulator [Salinicoccus sp. HZC-1]|uniref:MarR family winged helix-turn-helix transcriptional regulator n=1 Tax=Salinicoccus sp. HZC-1 TaxID=3385497 RepID=UPI00398AFA72